MITDKTTKASATPGSLSRQHFRPPFFADAVAGRIVGQQAQISLPLSNGLRIATEEGGDVVGSTATKLVRFNCGRATSIFSDSES